jgi:hypothetical protein
MALVDVESVTGPPAEPGLAKDEDRDTSALTFGRGAPLAVAFIAGCILLRIDDAYAAHHSTRGLVFTLFWIAQFIVFFPVALRVLSVRSSRSERIAILAAFALYQFVPKLLLDPNAPLYHDELSHWHQAESIFSVGHAFVFNSLLTILRSYPGLHILTVALQHFSALSTWRVGVIVVGVAHILIVLGIWYLLEAAGASGRVAAAGALIYALNPGFMYFDSQYAYESIALVFVVWTLALAMTSVRRYPSGYRVTLVILASAMALSCVVTHHISSYILTIALAFMAVGEYARQRRERSTGSFWGVATVTIVSAFAAAVWLFTVAIATLRYVTPHVQGGIRQVLAIIGQEQRARHLFTGSPVPLYERIATFATPVLIAVAAAGALWKLRRSEWRWRGAARGLSLFGLLYFVSLPMMLTAENEAARRSWTFTYIGLALLIAPFIVCLLEQMSTRISPMVASGTIAVALAVILVGNVTVQANAENRFPGPYVYGSDTRSLTNELLSSANWLRSNAGINNNVVAARDNGLAFGSTGAQNIARASRGFPVWELYFDKGLPSKTLLRDLRTSRYEYLVVDARMSKFHPGTGVYFVTDEPSTISLTPPTPEALDKFDHVPWATKIYSTDNLRIYRLDFSALNVCPAGPEVDSALAPGCKRSK